MIVDIFNSIATTKLDIVLNPSFWDSFNKDLFPITTSAWSEVKFLNDNLQLNEDLVSIPNNCGGIYAFVVKPEIIPKTHLYLMCIGRAQFTETQNLRKRCKEYLSQKRPKIKRMIDTWGKYIYIRYLVLSDNTIIKKTEAALINSILPPFNDEIPNKTIRDAVKAFRT